MTSRPEPPPVRELSHAQYSGWACCWCGKSLLDVTGAVVAGTSRGSSGVHVLDIEVYACPDCATPETPADRVDASRGRRDDGRISLGGEERPSR